MTTEILPIEERGRGATQAMIRKAYLAAMSQAITPDEVVGALRRAVEYADDRRDARAMVQVLELLMNYTIGRPSPYEERNTGDIDRILAILPQELIRRSFILARNEEDIDATGQSFTLPQDP